MKWAYLVYGGLCVPTVEGEAGAKGERWLVIVFERFAL